MKAVESTFRPEEFVWERVWRQETREFSHEETRLARGKRKAENLQALGFRPLASQRVLDLGCGTGDVSLLILRAFPDIPYEMVCVDRSPNAAAKLRQKAAGFPAVRVLEADVCAVPEPAGSFDQALAVSILEHVPTSTAFLQEVHRLLKPGGSLFLCQSNRLSFQYYDWRVRLLLKKWPYGFQQCFTPAALTAYLSPWFTVEEYRLSMPDPASPYSRLDRAVHGLYPDWGRNIFLRARRKD